MEVITAADPSAAPSPEVAVKSPPRALSFNERLAAYFELTKPRITSLVVLSALAGFALGSTSLIDWAPSLHTALGVALLSGGVNALNQYWERDLDALMRRTKLRPLPAGKLSPRGALASYLFLYTPLKTRTHWCTFIGAFPGALPPLLGWAAARNEVGVEAATLFGIMFLWQFPHFHAIATMCREDYARAGIRMLPVIEPDGKRTARQIVGYTVALIPVSLLPTFLHFSGLHFFGWIYLAGAVVLGGWFLHAGVAAAKQSTSEQSRRLLKVSVIYLPLLLVLMVLNRYWR